MIKAITHGGHIFLGLEEENIKRLKQGKPIHFDLSVFGLPGTCTISYGPTLQDIVNEWTAAGINFPKTPGKSS